MGRSKRFGVLCLVLSTLFWSFTGIFVKTLSLHGVDADVQNLFRYASATVGLWLLTLTVFRRETLAALRRLRSFLLPAAITCVFQVTMVSGLYRQSIYPGLQSLLSKSSVVFAALLAFLLFRDERKTILSRPYLVGGALGVVGVAGVVMFGERAQADFNEGVFLVILAAFLWACYTIAMKPVVRKTRPLIAFAIVSTFTTCFFIVLTSVRSRPAQFLDISARDQALIIVSGLICISAAHSLYFRAVERLGVAVCSSFLLVMPLITGVASAVLLGERLNGAQIVMGGVLLAGVYLSTLAGRQRGAERSEPAAGGR